jgi:hypothetical protein
VVDKKEVKTLKKISWGGIPGKLAGIQNLDSLDHQHQ